MIVVTSSARPRVVIIVFTRTRARARVEIIVVIVEVEVLVIVVIANVVVVPLYDIKAVEVGIGAEQSRLLLMWDPTIEHVGSHRAVPLLLIRSQILQEGQCADGIGLGHTCNAEDR